MLIFYMNQKRYAYPVENTIEFVSRAKTIEPCEKTVHHYCQSIGRQLSRSTGTTVENGHMKTPFASFEDKRPKTKKTRNHP